MQNRSLVRGALFALVCLVSSSFLPQTAHAVTVNPGDVYKLDFGSMSSPFGSIDIQFDLTGFSGADAFTVQLFDGSNSPLSGIVAGAATVAFNTSVAPFYALLKGTGGSFDLNSATAIAYASPNLGGAIVGSIPDAISATPLPTSLPLFLTGLVLVYGLVRRRKSGHTSFLPA